MKYTLKVENFGQVSEADITYGDLTVFVGPQATGKSILLQLFKLLIDKRNIFGELRKHGLDWEKNIGELFDTYFGEGMHSLWKMGKSQIIFNGEVVDGQKLAASRTLDKPESVFFIPAQRVLALRDGWPRPFTDYSPGDPFTVRKYSENLRILMEQEFGDPDKSLFPHARRFKAEIRDALSAAIFHGYGLKVDKHRAQKRLALSTGGKDVLPYMVWSAGQREFVPLLLGMYWLLPPATIAKRESVDWVVIEELEMGLHPKAITATMLLVLDLISRGYKVCLSTHSPQVLDVVWAITIMKNRNATSGDLLNIFEVYQSRQMRALAEQVLKKDFRVYAFDGSPIKVQDISNLDPGSSDKNESGWGGLSEFSGRVADIVASVVSKSESYGGGK